MRVSRRRKKPTPRLTVVGLVFLGMMGSACRGPRTTSVPPTTPAPVPKSKAPTQPAAPSVTNAITSGASLIRAMHDRHAPTWYHSVTFVQKTTVSLSSGGQVVQTWYEAGQLPGHFRIDTDPSSKAGVLYSGDSTYNFAGGKLVKADMELNELLVLGFDVYAQDPERTEAALRGRGFDLARFHEGTWRGMPIYVVGAARGDTTSKQFWVDRDRLLLVRLLENTRQGRSDYRLNEYAAIGGGWIATEVEQYVNGKRRLLEQNSHLRTNIALSDALFNPRKWATVPLWTP